MKEKLYSEKVNNLAKNIQKNTYMIVSQKGFSALVNF